MEGRQAMPRFVTGPGTLLNQCRLHKTKKHTRCVGRPGTEEEAEARTRRFFSYSMILTGKLQRERSRAPVAVVKPGRVTEA